MPYFDFECKKCGNTVNHLMKWSEDMHKHIDKCECGAKKWKNIISVSHSKTTVSDEDRGAYDLMGAGNRDFRRR